MALLFVKTHQILEKTTAPKTPPATGGKRFSLIEGGRKYHSEFINWCIVVAGSVMARGVLLEFLRGSSCYRVDFYKSGN